MSVTNDGRPAGGGRSVQSRWRRLERRDVDGLGALVPGLGVEGDLRALGERLEAAAVDAGVVDEEILAALVRRDEAEALVVVEPLHGSGRHGDPPTYTSVNCGREDALVRRLRALNTALSRTDGPALTTPIYRPGATKVDRAAQRHA